MVARELAGLLQTRGKIDAIGHSAIIAVLLTLAVPRYFGSLSRAREAVLKEDLFQMRDAIGKYYGDKEYSNYGDDNDNNNSFVTIVITSLLVSRNR